MDHYGVQWIVQANETVEKSCPIGASGTAFWSCDFVITLGRCLFRTQQPNYSGCKSQELGNIQEEINNLDVEVSDIWGKLENFTSPGDAYFGHEILDVLDLITSLLDRMDNQTEMTQGDLDLQVNSTQTGSQIINNLVTNDVQWFQMDQVRFSCTNLFDF